MNFDFPNILHNMPTVEELVGLYGSKQKANVGLKIARRIYIRTQLAEAQNWRCCYCGVECDSAPDKRNSATLEHVVCRTHGGKDRNEDCAMACYHCNNKRGTSDAMEFVPGENRQGPNKAERAQVRRDRKAHKRAGIMFHQNWVTNTGMTIVLSEWLTERRVSDIARQQIEYMYGEY